MKFLKSTHSEILKIISSYGWLTIMILILIIQPLLAWTEGKNIARIGLNATPATNPNLLQAIPPLSYLGVDSSKFGILPMVIFGGILGASEYKNHNLRTTLLCNSNRKNVLGAKLASFLICTSIISFGSIFLTNSIIHLSLGELGLNPIKLSSTAWKFIFYTTINWTFLTMISYAIGIIFKNMIIPTAFLVPQIYNLGDYIAGNWAWGKYLPFSAGNYIISIKEHSSSHDPLKGILILSTWALIAILVSFYLFSREQVGGKY